MAKEISKQELVAEIKRLGGKASIKECKDDLKRKLEDLKNERWYEKYGRPTENAMENETQKCIDNIIASLTKKEEEKNMTTETTIVAENTTPATENTNKEEKNMTTKTNDQTKETAKAEARAKKQAEKEAEKKAKAEARAKAKADREAKKQAEKEAKAKAKAERPVANDQMTVARNLVEELGYKVQATDNDLNVKHRFRVSDKNGKKQFRFDFSGKAVCTVKGTIKFEGAEFFEGKAHPYIRKNTPITKDAFATVLQALTDEAEEEAARQAEKEAAEMEKKLAKEAEKARKAAEKVAKKAEKEEPKAE